MTCPVHSVTIKLTFYQLIQTIYNEFIARGEGVAYPRPLPLDPPVTARHS